ASACRVDPTLRRQRQRRGPPALRQSRLCRIRHREELAEAARALLRRDLDGTGPCARAGLACTRRAADRDRYLRGTRRAEPGIAVPSPGQPGIVFGQTDRQRLPYHRARLADQLHVSRNEMGPLLFGESQIETVVDGMV